MTSRGKTVWSKRSIETILTNEKYVGDVILYKTFSPDFPEKKRIQNNGEHKKYIQEDHHPSIISREMFRAVREMRESRSNIERHADGTVTRKAKRYTGKKGRHGDRPEQLRRQHQAGKRKNLLHQKQCAGPASPSGGTGQHPGRRHPLPHSL